MLPAFLLYLSFCLRREKKAFHSRQTSMLFGSRSLANEGKDVENKGERKFEKNLHLFISIGLHAHTSWWDFLWRSLIDVEISSWDFSFTKSSLFKARRDCAMCSFEKNECLHSYVATDKSQIFVSTIPKQEYIDSIIFKFDGKLSSAWGFRRYLRFVQVFS